MTSRSLRSLALGLAAALGLAPQIAAPAEPAVPAATNAAAAQKHFATPEDAVAALVAALKAGDRKALLAIFGAEAEPLVESGDPVEDKRVGERFVARYEAAHELQKSGDSRVVLAVGKDDWPFPIPLLKEAAGWRFDTDDGQEEIIDRRIGRNELSAIQACLAFADAQHEFYALDPDRDGLLHYARRVRSSEGKRDGLYWPSAPDEAESPLGELFAQAKAEGYGQAPPQGSAPAKPAPFHGYFFRVLEAQGAHASGGAYDYVAREKMIGGFALLAWPAEYDVSGIMSFLVNQDNVVYQKDLGPETEKAAAAITRFDPDPSWTKVTDADEAPEATDSR